jgi:hypothetical protein
MIWYAYKDCPAGCRCSPLVAAPETQKTNEAPNGRFSSSSSAPAQCSEPTDEGKQPGCSDEKSLPAAPQPRATLTKPLAPIAPLKQSPAYREASEEELFEHGEVYAEPPAEPEDAVSAAEAWMDWLDDNGRLLFGGAVVVFLACTLLPSLVLVATGVGGGSPEDARDAAAANAAAAKAKMEAEAKVGKPAGKAD